MGTYPVQSESRRGQLFWCSQGQHQFSETHFSELWGKQGSLKEYVQTAKLFTDGLATTEIANVLEKDERRIASRKAGLSQESAVFLFTV